MYTINNKMLNGIVPNIPTHPKAAQLQLPSWHNSPVVSSK